MDPYYLAGVLFGRIITVFILAYILLWLYAKISHSDRPKTRNIILTALILFVLSIVGNLTG